jgi:pentafunctional AROM polypeptide
MGRLAGKFLGYKFLDMDHLLEAHVKQTIPQFLETHSWEEFRALEAQLLFDTLTVNPKSNVIACGGGIIETEFGRKTLKTWNGKVIHITRKFTSIEHYLNIDKTRPLYGEDLQTAWNRRRPLYQECASLEFVSISPSDSDWSTVDRDFKRFLKFTLNIKPFELPTSVPSFFVSLTFSDVESVADILETITEGAHAIELRVDLLKSQDVEFVGQQLALLRSLSPLPIVFTVRTKAQGGALPDSEFAAMMTLLTYGIRWGCEYLDVQFAAPFERFDSIIP